MFKATLDFMFKTKRLLTETTFKETKNDSSSELFKSPLKVIEAELKEKGADVYKGHTLNDLALQEYHVESTVENIENLQANLNDKIESINEIVRTKVIELRSKLDECKANVKQALISEKKLIGETYTAIVPISKEYTTTNTTATLEDGVILGAGYDTGKEIESVLELDTLNIIGEESTKFKISGKSNAYPLILSTNKNLYNPFNQFKIVLPTITQSGILLIKFDKEEAISVLNREGYEIVSKHINNTVRFPVDSSSKSFSIRFLDNSKRDIKINAMYFTEAIYNKETIYETFPIDINKDLSYITVESCDNYASKDVSIKYEISINGEEFEEYRPSGKLKDSLVQSIIKTDKYGYNEPLILENPERDEGVFKFYPDTPIAQSSKLRSFSVKLGEDILSLESFLEPKGTTGFIMNERTDNDFLIALEKNRLTLFYNDAGTSDDIVTINIVVKEAFDFYVNEGSYVVLDNIKYRYEDLVEGELHLRKGLHTLEFKKAEWKETVDLAVYEITTLDSDFLEVMERETGEKSKIDFYFNVKEKQYNSYYLQFWLQKVDIYLFEDNVKRKYNNNYLEYFYKDNPYKTYILNESPSRLVDTVQIRATMKSINEVVCPYISKIIIRGI